MAIRKIRRLDPAYFGYEIEIASFLISTAHFDSLIINEATGEPAKEQLRQEPRCRCRSLPECGSQRQHNS